MIEMLNKKVIHTTGAASPKTGTASHARHGDGSVWLVMCVIWRRGESPRVVIGEGARHANDQSQVQSEKNDGKKFKD